MRVFGKSCHERQVNVYVRIDESRKHQLSSRIDGLSARRYIEGLSDRGNGLILDLDIAAGTRIRRDHFTTLDQQTHLPGLPAIPRLAASHASMDANALPLPIGLHRLPVLCHSGLLL